MTKPKIIIVPGNGNSHIESDNWYAWVRDELVKRRYEVVAEDMPDPEFAHANVWLPHIENNLLADENTIIIGHSSGGVAALRYLESHKLRGAIIIGTNYTDLGEPTEKESGYYDAQWQWDKIKANAGWIVQFISSDDPYIPANETQLIHDMLGTELHTMSDRGHFMTDHNPVNNTFPELLDVIERKTASIVGA
jgi:predicted alpha/beta hydrolase family esterase